jgi:DHA3 family macrolide efflux protein-like MFS transporter
MSDQRKKNWRVRFFTIWGGQAVSLFGSHLVQFALVWYLTQETGSATVLATATLAGFLPQVVLGPLVGTLVDRWNRRWTMVGADAGIALATLLLAYLFAFDRVSISWIYLLLFVRSLGGGFHHPAMSAATTLMVPKDQLTRVQGLNQMLQGALGIVAAPLGALAVGLLSTQAILTIDVLTAGIAILPLLFIAIPEPVRNGGQPTAEKPSFWSDFRAGFRYVLAWPGLLMLMLMATLLNFLLNPTGALMPLLVTEHFGGGAVQLGWLESSFGAGILAGGITLSVWGGFKKRIVTSMIGVIGLGLFFGMLGILPGTAFPWAIAVAFCAAFTIPLVNGPIQAIMQATVAPEMQGRVFTLAGSIASAMAPVGLILAGPLADTLGIRSWYVIAGAICVLTGLAGNFIPAVMTIEENRREAEPAAPEAPAEAALADPDGV